MDCIRYAGLKFLDFQVPFVEIRKVSHESLRTIPRTGYAASILKMEQELILKLGIADRQVKGGNEFFRSFQDLDPSSGTSVQNVRNSPKNGRR